MSGVELLERDVCLRELEASLADAQVGHGRTALVAGEAGIGKTSLVERCVDAAKPRWRVLWGACDAQFTPRPLGPLHDMAGSVRGALPRLLSDGADRSSLFSAVLEELRGRPTVAVFEDIHWADETTLDLLGFLARRIGSCPTVLMLTYRDDELGPRHPLRLLLGDLASSAHTRRVSLPRLTEDAVRLLVGSRGLDAVALHQLTGGNPFFVTEVLANSSLEIPPTVRDAVLARLARLSDGGQEVVQAAAVVGPRIEPSLLAAMGFTDAASIDECVSLGVLIAHADVLAFRHDIARQTILESISPARRISLHQQALRVLRAGPSARQDAARLAHHAQGAADCAAILEYAPAAAHQAAAATAHREAATLYGLALGCADELPPAERASLLEAYSWECNVIDQRPESIAARQSAISLWESNGNTLKAAENLARLVPMLIRVGHNAEAERCSNQAISLLEVRPPGPELALAYRTRALVALSRRDATGAIHWGERAIELAEQTGDEDVAGMTRAAVGSAWLILDFQHGHTYLEEHLHRALTRGRETHAANLFAHLGYRSADVYQFDEAEHHLAQGIAYTDGRDLDTFQLLMLAWQSLAQMHLGRWSLAAETSRSVLLRGSMSGVNRLPALVALGRLHARAELPDAQAALDEALELADAIDTSETLGQVRAARAEAAWLSGERARALEEACAGFDVAVRERHVWVAGELAYWRWRAGDTPPDLEWLAEPFVQEMAGDWRGAAASWQRLNCPYEEARALADGDESARHQALRIMQRLGARSVAQSIGRALRAEGVSGVPRGPYASTRGNPFGLTSRQVDILTLLAADLSNVEIARRLSIAPKTVDHHVAAVLAKLDVHSRREAVAVARGSGILDQK
jgi:DNA-binding CsgD family transcriptional regulator/tetratricopeptide (TPR) repeat protein